MCNKAAFFVMECENSSTYLWRLPPVWPFPPFMTVFPDTMPGRVFKPLGPPFATTVGGILEGE